MVGMLSSVMRGLENGECCRGRSGRSQVKFGDLAHLTRDTSRTTLTIVTLYALDLLLIVDMGDHTQESNTEHSNHLDLLSPRKIQSYEHGHRYDNNGQVDGYVDRRSSPCCRIHIDTHSAMLSIPTCPCVRNWQALKRGDDNVHESIA